MNPNRRKEGSRPDKDLVTIGAVTDEGRQHDARIDTGEPRHLVDHPGIEKVQVARFEHYLDLFNTLFSGVIMEGSSLETGSHLRLPGTAMDDALGRAVARRCVLQHQHPGELVLKGMNRVAGPLLPQADRIEMRRVGVTAVMRPQDRRPVETAIALPRGLNLLVDGKLLEAAVDQADRVAVLIK